MLGKKDYQELFQLEPQFVKTLDIYTRTKEVYRRTKLALGQIPSFKVTVSCTQKEKVNYGTSRSTKIYTNK